jgi:predicted component of type VI protein secretion system
MPWLALGTTTHELREGDTAVGSGPETDWRVSTADLTPRHFVLRLRAGNATVEASSPDHIVTLNGRQIVEAAPVREGDVILAGSGRFSYSLEQPRASALGDETVVQAYLVDEAERVAHPLINRSTPIGRDASNAVVVRDPTASRFHAEVRREAGGFAIHSMGAMGTLLNGRPLEHPSMLHDGDVVEIAFAKLRFTRQAPGGGIAMASPHLTGNDESGRRPTLETSERMVADEDSPAGRHTRRVQVFVVLAIVLVGVLWWTLGRRQ